MSGRVIRFPALERLVFRCRVSVLVAATTFVGALPGGVATADNAKEASARQAVESVYRPAHEEFVASAVKFSDVTRLLCSTGSDVTLKAVRERFAKLVFDFSRVEFYRVGPLLENNRQNRLFYWPDKRNVGERQLRDLLNTANLGDIDLASFQNTSVAVQGLPAIERLLYARNAEAMFADTSESAYCSALNLMADNVNSMARELRDEWQNDDGITKQLLRPSADSLQFRSQTEVLRSMVTQIAVGIDNLLQRKVQPLLDHADSPAAHAVFWRSGSTIDMLEGNLESLRALIIDSQLASRAALESELAFEFRTASGLLKKLHALQTLTDSSNALSAEALSLLRTLAAVLDGIRFTVHDRFMAKLDVSAGFNSDDGD